MTSTTRREEYSSNIIRTLHPTTTTTTTTSHSTNNDLNENIDYLLDDLQHSVTGTSQYLKSRNVQHLSPANTTTYIKERSISPGRSEFQNDNKVYKTSSYQYATSSSTGGSTAYDSSQNVNQLDTLLQDLKKERELSTREKDYTLLSTHSSGFESGRLDTRSPTLSGTKSPNLNESRVIEDKISIKRDVIFDPLSPQSSPRWQTSTPSEKNHMYEKRIESTTTKDVSFADKPDVRQTPTLTRSEKYIENRTIPHYESSTITSRDILSDDLKDVPLSDDILPIPGTKVTTTVRTYTYEIPAEPTTLTASKKVLYKREIDSNETNSSLYPPAVGRELPPSVTYTTESYRTTTNDAPDHNVPTIKSTKTLIRKQDVNLNETTSNTYVDRNVTNEYVTEHTPLIESNVHYRRDVRDTSRDIVDSRGPHATPPSTGGPVRPGGPHGPHGPSGPGGPDGPVTYYYKHHETTNTTNTLYGPPNGHGPGDHSYPPPQSQPSRPYPGEPGGKTIKYSTYTSTQTRSGGDREPLLQQPAPFPVDGNTGPVEQIDSPPKRLDDLMASLGNDNVNVKATDVEHISRKEVETGVATAERPPPSKNVAGPPVYYPPGREMFVKKEESSAAYRAGGQYARAAGKYEYEAGSKSKSKSKSGATMVPVCLPLCCAMPCSIM